MGAVLFVFAAVAATFDDEGLGGLDLHFWGRGGAMKYDFVRLGDLRWVMGCEDGSVYLVWC